MTEELTSGSPRKRTLRSADTNPNLAKKRALRSSANLTPLPATAVTKQIKAKVTLSPEILALTDAQLYKLIEDNHFKKYKTIAKDVQVKAVVALVRGLDTFVLDGTGYGKTRIAEMFLDLFPKKNNPISIVINPLDALGDNQVAEKKRWQIEAVNLTKENFTDTVVMKIMAGFYSVLYVSPEIFLNSKLFERLYFSKWLQNHLVLKVIDEAHMIYWWGLVQSGRASQCNAFMRQQDGGQFRPSYGNLCLRFLATNKIPLLMMSATCAPGPFSSILSSLSIQECNLKIVQGELSRSNIRIIRIKVPSGTRLTKALLDLYSRKDVVPDNELVKSLIYSGSRNATGTVMEVVNEARGILKGECDPDSTLIRRYHSCTGRKEKIRTIEGYTNNIFPIISCTNALGLGQDWPTVMEVIVMGRMGIPELTQLFGRCGRGSGTGLAIHFVETLRRNGTNIIDDFDDKKEMKDDDLMDAFTLTPICLRVALSLGNTIGVIPCKVSDPRVLAEQAHEKDEGFPECKCSNCDSVAADVLVHNMSRLTKSNYCQAMEDVSCVEGFLNPHTNELDKDKMDDSLAIKATKKKSRLLDCQLEELADELVFVYDLFHKHIYEDSDYCFSSDYFGLDRAKKVVQSLDEITCEGDIKDAMGGDIIKGGVKAVFDYITNWKTRDEVIDYQKKQAEVMEKNKKVEERRAQKAFDLKKAVQHDPDLACTPTPIKPQRKRRTTDEIKAEKKASALKAAYHK